MAEKTGGGRFWIEGAGRKRGMAVFSRFLNLIWLFWFFLLF